MNKTFQFLLVGYLIVVNVCILMPIAAKTIASTSGLLYWLGFVSLGTTCIYLFLLIVLLVKITDKEI